MISIDTNVIVRFLTRDDEQQYKKAFKLFKTKEIYIPDTVILETEWVLRFAYEFSAKDICVALKKLFGLKNILLSNPSYIAQAIEWCEQGMDFSDALHLAHCQQYENLYTFDKSFISKAKNLTKCLVVSP